MSYLDNNPFTKPTPSFGTSNSNISTNNINFYSNMDYATGTSYNKYGSRARE